MSMDAGTPDPRRSDPLFTAASVRSEYQGAAWWLDTLAKAMLDRNAGRLGSRSYTRSLTTPCRVRPGLNLLHDYLIGDPPLLGYADNWKQHFLQVMRMGRLNAAELVVNSKADRMPLRGFRTAAATDQLGDQVARQILRLNKGKVLAREVHSAQLWAADSYGMATPRAAGGHAVMTFEDPRETITAHDPATGETLAALKLYRDEWDSRDIAHLFVRTSPTEVDHYPLAKTRGSSSMSSTGFRMNTGWELTDVVAQLDRMPLIRFKNRHGRGEYERHLDTLDRINDQIMNKAVIAKVQAFRQMAIKGLPEHAVQIVDGKPTQVTLDYTDAFEAAPGSLWQLPADVEMWESQPTDLGPIRLAIKDDLQHLAAVTQTSLPAITPDATTGSAEGAALMREEEVFAVEACMDYAHGSWAEFMAAAFAFDDDPEVRKRADVTQIEPMWGPIERFGLTERSSAASQAISSLPREAIWTDVWGYDAADIPRLHTQAGADLLFAPPAPSGSGAPAVTFRPPTPPAARPATPPAPPPANPAAA